MIVGGGRRRPGAIALPSYRNAMLKGNRADAKAVLMESAQYMERYFTTNNTYVGATPLRFRRCRQRARAGVPSRTI